MTKSERRHCTQKKRQAWHLQNDHLPRLPEFTNNNHDKESVSDIVNAPEFLNVLVSVDHIVPGFHNDFQPLSTWDMNKKKKEHALKSGKPTSSPRENGITCMPSDAKGVPVKAQYPSRRPRDMLNSTSSLHSDDLEYSVHCLMTSSSTIVSNLTSSSSNQLDTRTLHF
ncbi:MAG TPA: hypothetical protein VGO47_05980 [Chlamydiales bacterium]|nr:hypothetical protein [Chlamydiales bacterium]